MEKEVPHRDFLPDARADVASAMATMQAATQKEVVEVLRQRQHLVRATANNTARALLMAVLTLEVLRLMVGGQILKRFTGHEDPLAEVTSRLWADVSWSQHKEQQQQQQQSDRQLKAVGQPKHTTALQPPPKGAAQLHRKLGIGGSQAASSLQAGRKASWDPPPKALPAQKRQEYPVSLHAPESG
ncbi:hypothetical protein N2152v2_006688 [Parachlorella kessleri]